MTRRAFADFDALTVARVLLDESSAVALALRTLFPCVREAASAGLLRALDLDASQLLAAPDRTKDESARSYCPSCHALFSVEGGSCPDCHGVAVVAFAAAPA